jgi:hypothetical protein
MKQLRLVRKGMAGMEEEVKELLGQASSKNEMSRKAMKSLNNF